MPQNFRLRFNGALAARQMREGAARGLYLGTEHVLGVSINRVPLDEGYLQSTGTASVDEPSLTGMVSFDGPYAVRQHEELEWRHAPGRTAKYLENSLNESRQVVAAIIAAEIRRAMR
ncbi:hypothetical protein [Streptomyces purpurascens]|uniref:hypothetical protein n=1 Tax=Streptomyces purpurascens TaxID=1924 RepID=UPI00167B5E3C|nr:hypothetical protein [Streptomyces purpurascens]MCE7049562.1 hypothetical protein [Streptomyces purpurascens]GHA22594.1 hypothetical protein GCM10010303_36400 [Streptomyces purpurascens]